MRYNSAKRYVFDTSLNPIGRALDTRSKYYDSTLEKERPYLSKEEVEEAFPTPAERDGQFNVIINTGGTLVNGVVTGGTNEVWFWKEADGELTQIISTDTVMPTVETLGLGEVIADINALEQTNTALAGDITDLEADVLGIGQDIAANVEAIEAEQTARVSAVNETNGYLSVKDAMVTVACGNSISAQSKFNGASWNTGGELHLSNILSGSPMVFKMITPTTRCDRYGVYGFSGARLGKFTDGSTILSDIDLQWIAPIQSAGVVPNLVVGIALLENDLAAGRTVDEMKQSLISWLRVVQNTWAGVIIHLIAPRPSFTYNTAQIVANYQQIRDYVLSLDNNHTLFVSRGDAYEDPLNAGVPTKNSITASISGTTMTVTSGSNIKVGQLVASNNTLTTYGVVSAYGTGTGGVGTYVLSSSSTVASTSLITCPYTDNGPHPNAAGALILARVQKVTLARIAKVWRQTYKILSNNIGLQGTTAMSGGSGLVTGTAPTGFNYGGGTVSEGTQTFLAELPSCKVTVTSEFRNGPAGANLVFYGMGSIALSGVTQISPFVIIEILTGAENIKFIKLYPRINDGSGNAFQNYVITSGTNETEADYQNGDVLTFRCPPLIAASGSITALQNYIAHYSKLTGGTFTYRVLSQGVGVVV